MFGVLVGGEPRREGRDLEENAARLAEVDRAEVVAILDGGDEPACAFDATLPGKLLLVRGRPGDVVDRARARQRALGRRIVGPAEAPLHAVEPVLAPTQVVE